MASNSTVKKANKKKFDDGFPNIFRPNARGIRGQHVAFLASFSSPSRMEDDRDVATAFMFARVLSNIPISMGGPTSLVIYDIHALQEQFYVGDNILPCFENEIPLLKNRLQQLPDFDNISIAFPDNGAWKRFHKQLYHFPTVSSCFYKRGVHKLAAFQSGKEQRHQVEAIPASSTTKQRKRKAHHSTKQKKK
ncbi:hypothetical protein ACFX2I_000560 [Malus domestica]